jgi:hypothetical protein
MGLLDIGKKALDTATGGVVSGALGLALGGINNKRQIDQQQKLTDMQLQANKNMSVFQQQQQKEMWDYTNYENQKQHLENAGLNPALMYGMSGGGGATVGGGATTSGGASQAPQGGHEVMDMLQMQTQKAQIELMEAQANKANTEAQNIKGVQTENTVANTANTNQQTENAKLEAIIKEYTGKDLKAKYEANQTAGNYENKARTEYMQDSASYGIAENMWQMYTNGQLANKTNAEIESLLINNAKSKAQEKQIYKTMDLIQEQTKGASLDNILKDLEAKFQTEIGAGGTAINFLSRFLQILTAKHL